mmetsp:Transcript_8941/g.14544  ORF Transcript_8941/g.14544 Transcript_8941/m.14544 type:complete len:143 (-) Transcript_8941:607-1035(-)
MAGEPLRTAEAGIHLLDVLAAQSANRQKQAKERAAFKVSMFQDSCSVGRSVHESEGESESELGGEIVGQCFQQEEQGRFEGELEDASFLNERQTCLSDVMKDREKVEQMTIVQIKQASRVPDKVPEWVRVRLQEKDQNCNDG